MSRGWLVDAERHFHAGDYARSASLCAMTLMKRKNDIEAMALLGYSQLFMGRPGEAVETLEAARKLVPGHARTLLALGQAQSRLGRHEEALETLERAVSVAPRDPNAIAACARAMVEAGRREDAAAMVGEKLEKGAMSPELASIFSRLTDERPRAIDLLRRSLNEPGVPAAARMEGLFRLGRLLEEEGDAEGAWDAYSEANALRGARFDADAHRRAVDRAIRAWSRVAFADLPRAGAPESGPRPVFICGMPRSGTTLLEQVLAAHPDVHGAGEIDFIRQAAEHLQRRAAPDHPEIMQDLRPLNQPTVQGLSDKYRAAVAQQSGGAPVVTDKLPANIMNLGLIALCFPDARIIRCVRDPMDNAISCYAHAFAGPLHWSYSVEGIASYMADERRIAGHWRGLLGGIVREQSYEAFVEDPEGQTREVLEFIGLAWDEACLRFHESGRIARTQSWDQVTRPVHASSVGRGRAFADRLAPVTEMVGEAGGARGAG